MVSGKTVAIAATVTAAVAGLSYIAYFDYKRRHDRTFRRKLKRDRKKAQKKADDVSKSSPDAINDIALELLNEIANDKLPVSAEDKEKFFLAQVSKGETMCGAGPSAYPLAACHFFQALKVYPNPVELVMIYQKTTPTEVFKLVMAMMAQEVRQKQMRYFDVFPPPEKNVQIKDKNKIDAKADSKAKEKKAASAESDKSSDVVVPSRALFSIKSFEKGESIYEEEAVVSTLLPRAQNGQFCDNCMKSVPNAAKQRPEETTDKSEIAEKAENEEADPAKEIEKADDKEEKETSGSIEEKKDDDAETTEKSFAEVAKEAAASDENTTPLTEGSEVFVESKEEIDSPKETKSSTVSNVIDCEKCHKVVYCSEKCRQDAYDAYHQFLCANSDNTQAREFAELAKESHELAPILIAKFFGVLVDREKKKELARALGSLSGSKNADESDADEYTVWEHLECMRYLELIPSATDAAILDKLGKLISTNVPGFTEFISGDRYTMLKGKLDYNAYAVHGSADIEIPAETEATHVSDTIRDDHSATPVGISLYLISSHITHSCDPNAQIVFPDNTSKAAIKALKPIAKGDELRVSFVDTSLDVETRQKLLKNTYRFTCECDKCKSDLAAVAANKNEDDKEDSNAAGNSEKQQPSETEKQEVDESAEHESSPEDVN
ncbi:mitochondrial import receptor subunit tom20 [Coemansia sp. RSA 1804]|nr:mitochondrial import receptor subunit tom20 [Coemansia sp. RSA 1804]